MFRFINFSIMAALLVSATLPGQATLRRREHSGRAGFRKSLINAKSLANGADGNKELNT